MPLILSLPGAVALIAYLVLAWRFGALWRGHVPPFADHPLREQGVVGGVLALHGLALALPGIGLLNMGVGEAVSLVAWLTIGLHWAIRWCYRLEGLQWPLMLMGAMGCAAALVLPASYTHGLTASPALALHIIVSLMGYSLFLLAAMMAGLMLVIEKRLHARNLKRLPVKLPPLLKLESLLFQTLGVALALLTVTVVTGTAFSEAIFGRPFALTHKSVFSFVSWGVFALLLFGHWRWGWRGRLAAHWTLAGMVFLFLAYLGSKMVMEVILYR